jgi:alpha-aminoadipate carrier protein LysW
MLVGEVNATAGHRLVAMTTPLTGSLRKVRKTIGIKHDPQVPTGKSGEMMTTTCPECAADVAFADRPRLSEVVECGDCHSELEVMTLDPLNLVMAPQVEEDWGE